MSAVMDPGAHTDTAAEPLIQASLLGEAVDSGPVAVFVADEQMRYVAVNEYAASLLGYSRAELLKLDMTLASSYHQIDVVVYTRYEVNCTGRIVFRHR